MSERFVDPRASMDNMPRQGIPYWGNPDKYVPGQGSVRWRQRAIAAEAKLADAWDEGVRYATGSMDADVSDNPYRKEN